MRIPRTDHIVIEGRGLEADYAAHLIDSLGLASVRLGGTDGPHPAEAWAASGAMALTGFAAGPPLMCPAPLASCAAGAARALNALVRGDLDIDGAALLGARAAFSYLRRHGAIAPGGKCRLLTARDGMFALNLAREDDWELLPAWLEQDCAHDWEAVAALVAVKAKDDLVARGRLLGLAIAPDEPPSARDWFHLHTEGEGRLPSEAAPRVIDLSALWAGPLAAQLLRRAGARVIKVESPARPDGARRGNPQFFASLNAGKEELSLDFVRDRDELRTLIQTADIVIDGSRPRALQQLGFVAEEFVHARPGLVWVSITGYGRDEPEADWIAFGDDAGVAAGLSHIMREAHGSSLFCADAVADPLTGLHAALAALAFHRQGRGGLVSLALRDVVAHCALFHPPSDGWRARAEAWSAHLAARGLCAAPPRAYAC